MKKSCYECIYYSPGYPDSYEEPGQDPSCEHERSFIVMFNYFFDLNNGCKNFESLGYFYIKKGGKFLKNFKYPTILDRNYKFEWSGSSKNAMTLSNKKHASLEKKTGGKKVDIK
jgi:hypothetical protein